MASTIDYDIVILTSNHSFSGKVSLRDQRLSDFLNNRHDAFFALTKVSVARLNDPGNVLEQDAQAVITKNDVLIAFEPPQKAIPAANRFFGYVRKERTDVFIAVEGMEIRGILHTNGPLELERFLALSSDLFVPVTNARVTLQANTRYVIEQAAIMVNVRQIRYLAKVEVAATSKPATGSSA